MSVRIKNVILSLGIILFIFVVILFYFIVFAKKSKQAEVLNIEINIENISVSVKENSLNTKGIVLIFSSINEFIYTTTSGEYYTIYCIENNMKNKLPIRGRWDASELETSRPATKLLETTIDWSNKYGELKKGTYVIEQEISINGTSGKFSIEFKIL